MPETWGGAAPYYPTMTKQPATLTARLNVLGPGQHIAYLSAPISAPPMLSADRIRARRHSDQGVSALYLVEYWGESTAISNGKVGLVEEDPRYDWPWLLDEGIGKALVDLPTVTVGGGAVDVDTASSSWLGHAATVRFRVSGEWRGDLEIMVPARHPVAYITAVLSPISMLPPRTPVPIVVSIPGLVPMSVVVPVLSCRCHAIGSLRPTLQVVGNPERDRALHNAASTPRFASVVPVAHG